MKQEFEFFEEQEVFPEASNPSEERILTVRLDKWLWAARFFKTRALARAAIEAGKVYYNGERSKPSREIEIGALLQIYQGRLEKTILVKGLSTRRRSTEGALQLFEEIKESRLIQEPSTYPSPVFQSQSKKSHFLTAPEQNQKRPVRFLRRSLLRSDAHPRMDRSLHNNASSPKKEVEYWE